MFLPKHRLETTCHSHKFNNSIILAHCLKFADVAEPKVKSKSNGLTVSMVIE